jgi:hypothetical protein
MVEPESKITPLYPPLRPPNTTKQQNRARRAFYRARTGHGQASAITEIQRFPAKPLASRAKLREASVFPPAALLPEPGAQQNTRLNFSKR